MTMIGAQRAGTDRLPSALGNNRTVLLQALDAPIPEALVVFALTPQP